MTKLLELTTKTIIDRGLEYYLENHVEEPKTVLIEGEEYYHAKVKGSHHAFYETTINLLRPNQSSCTCPYAHGKVLVCKHMVALLFKLYPNKVKEYDPLAYVKYYKKLANKKVFIEMAVDYINQLSEVELKEHLFSYMLEENERKGFI